MDIKPFLIELSENVSVTIEKLTNYIEELITIQDIIHEKYGKVQNLDDTELVQIISILDKKCREILIQVIVLQNLSMDKKGDKNRSIRTLKNRIHKYTSEIISTSNIVDEKILSFNYLMTKKIKNFLNFLKNNKDRLEQLVDEE